MTAETTYYLTYKKNIMKRLFQTLLIVAALSHCAAAQPFADTVVGRHSRYYYSSYYDTCPCFSYDSAIRDIWLNQLWFEKIFDAVAEPDLSRTVVKRDSTSHPIAVKGLAAITDRRENHFDDHIFSIVNYSLDEKLFLGAPSGDTLIPISDSLSFNPLRPDSIIYLSLDDSNSQSALFDLHEVYFKAPVYVDSIFYIAGTAYNDRQIYDADHHQYYYPTRYFRVRCAVSRTPEASCFCRSQCEGTKLYLYSQIRNNPHGYDTTYLHQVTPNGWGPFFIIADFYNVSTAAADSAQGYTTGNGRYSDLTNVTFTARNRHGYIFSHWNDGNTDNPRTIFLTSDTSFTAYFRPSGPHTVSVVSLNPNRGSVSGSGTYLEGDSVTIAASPSQSHFLFSHWNDGSTQNPRTIFLTQDTTFSATFRTKEIFVANGLSNNYNWGYVRGNGQFHEFDTAHFTPIPQPGYTFLNWEDGVTDNPRHVVVVQDTFITAIFGPATSDQGFTPPETNRPAGKPLFTLAPNPTNGQVAVTLAQPSPAGCRLVLLDAAGHETITLTPQPGSQSLSLDLSHLPAGTYFLTISTPQGSATQKLILQ